ncbi:hypothetical protein [[Limnothrix rosea] IAM M-220]|uniref:hypothetical protein n=1 Tax=[Limnothrix rosea] IAM M-220 TaxID=454133 RepID=UPI0011159DD2|nr:hypothetical protein [[Limnothrix rosea] IAM M-220]
MSDQNHGRLVKRSLYEEYESSSSGGLCFDPSQPAFLGTITLSLCGLIAVALVGKIISPSPTVVYPPTQPIINNN